MEQANGPKQPDGWERLTCTCGQNRFAKTVSLRWKNGGGVVEEPQGYFCMECHAVVNSGALIHKAELAAKKRELRELEAELSDVHEGKKESKKETKEKAGAAA